jgi:hypothetical protein
MQTFYGEVRKKLPDLDGHARFAFQDVSGAILELTLRPGVDVPREGQQGIVIGERMAPGTIFAEEIRQEMIRSDAKSGEAVGPP